MTSKEIGIHMSRQSLILYPLYFKLQNHLKTDIYYLNPPLFVVHLFALRLGDKQLIH